MNVPIEQMKSEKDRLLSDFLKGREDAFPTRLTEILDTYFQESFAESSIGPQMHMEKNPGAFIALGGYGRREQCLHSDVDILFLFDRRVPDEARNLIQEILYPLWDAGLEVGYSTRSLKNCVKLASEDFEVLTSLMDARLLCGFSPLYSSLMEEVWDRVLRKRSNTFIRWLAGINRERHTLYGDAAYLLEPNIKEGQGGLRDYHAILWAALAKYRIRETNTLYEKGHLTDEECQALEESVSFILKTRSWLHHISGRKCDQLYFEYQVKMAESLGYRDHQDRRAVEQFLGEMHGHMEFLKKLHMTFIDRVAPGRPIFFSRKAPLRLRRRGLKTTRGMLDFKDPASIPEDPLVLVQIFEQSALREAPLSIEAKRSVRKHLRLVNAEYRTSHAVIEALRRIVATSPKAFSALKEMFDTGILVSLIPEMKGITNLIQYDEYHLYPVDLHSLKTVQALRNFDSSYLEDEDTLARQIYGEIPDIEPLTWAALFHDIGKGISVEKHASQGAEMAGKILARMSFSDREIDVISLLIREHLSLVKTATHRDILDEKNVVRFASKFRSTDELKMLYLLTAADGKATGPKAWNAWIKTLVTELFFKTIHIIEGGELAAPESTEIVDEKKKEVFARVTSMPEDELRPLFKKLSPRYLLYTEIDDILHHIRLYQALDKAPYFVLDAKKEIGQDYRIVSVVAKDSPGLFSCIAGAFTLNNLNILNASIYTWGDETAVDTFTVTAPPDNLHEEQAWNRVRMDLQAVFSGDIALDRALRKKLSSQRPVHKTGRIRPDRVVIDNAGSDFFTIVEVYTHDFPGLLYRITSTLFRLGLDVRVAKIATKVDQVVDVFYVRTFEGQKVGDEEMEAHIRSTILEEVDKGP